MISPLYQRNDALSAGMFVPESRFGMWFLKTETWAVHVLLRALKDLERLIPARLPAYPTIVDVGCGRGRSFGLLKARFRPDRMIGIDVDGTMLEIAAAETARDGLEVEFQQTTSSRLMLPDASVDMIFCHQTFHHLMDQEAALQEFNRVLKPGGLFLFAESTRKYIHSPMIRLLFRHPMDVQRTAPEYLAMIRTAGFDVGESAISYPYLWWSRNDLGLFERWFGIKPPKIREETLLNCVAVKR
ncbi:class I SAM-dependent methyltransferase [Dongia sp.]|uniref:class I SAM-dependent methyltransferase n=1 Tax=Dongia sp. TaxID=1977262 RepID=UPI0035ADABEA